MQQIRLERLRSYLATDCKGVTAELVRRSKKKQSYVSDLLRGKKSFGEKAARGIEAKLGLTPGWLDQAEANPATVVREERPRYADMTIPERIASRVSQFDEGVQLAILNLIETFNGQAIEHQRVKRKSPQKQP